LTLFRFRFVGFDIRAVTHPASVSVRAIRTIPVLRDEKHGMSGVCARTRLSVQR